MRMSDWSSDVCSSDLVLVYASYSKGYKSGTFNGRATSGPALNVVLPENSDSYEIGVKSQFWDRRVTLNLSVYDVTYKNLQTTVTVRDSTGAPATALINARSEEHTSELQSLMRISYAVFCLKKKTNTK